MKGNFIYPGGAGGRWLNYLIYSLENNLPMRSYERINFHQDQLSTQILVTHAPESISLSNLMPLESSPKTQLEWINSPKTWRVYSSKYTFNLWLNNTKKWALNLEANPDCLRLNELQTVDFLKRITLNRLGDLYKTAYMDSIDLEYCWLFQDSALFVNSLFEMLDSYNVYYYKNYTIAMDGISEFRKTCVDPSTVVGQDHIYWYGWCLGVLERTKSLKFDLVNLDQVKQDLAPWNEFCINFTAPLMFYTKEI